MRPRPCAPQVTTPDKRAMMNIGVAIRMTDQQLYVVIGAPMLFNAVLIALMMAYVNAKISGVNERSRP